MTTFISKALGYALLRPTPGPAVSKLTAYAVVRLPAHAFVSQSTTYVVLREGEPPAPDVEVKVSKTLLYAVLQPGPNGPLSYVTAAGADLLHGGLSTARVTGLAAEVLARRNGRGRISTTLAEVLTSRSPAAFITGAVLEVLRSTAEVTVSALVSTVALDVLNTPPNVNVRVSSNVVEVLMPASDDSAIGSVWALG